MIYVDAAVSGVVAAVFDCKSFENCIVRLYVDNGACTLAVNYCCVLVFTNYFQIVGFNDNMFSIDSCFDEYGVFWACMIDSFLNLERGVWNYYYLRFGNTKLEIK